MTASFRYEGTFGPKTNLTTLLFIEVSLSSQENPEKKTIDLPQVTDKRYHIIYRIHLP